MHVSLILIPGFKLLPLLTIQEIFETANACAGRPIFDLKLHSLDGGPVKSAEGVSIPPDTNRYPDVSTCEMVLLLARHDALKHLPMGLRGFLGQMAQGTATLGGLDSGAQILAELGFLDHHGAALADDAARPPEDRWPRIQRNAQPVALDRNRLTSRGGFAPAQALLLWIAQHSSPSLASEIASTLHLPTPPGLAPIEQEAQASGDPILARMQSIMWANLNSPLAMERIAGELELSPKQMRTRCQNGLGMTPMQVYLDIRLDRANRLITETELSVNEVAQATGFASPSAFTRSYRARFDETPRAVRSARRA